MPGVYQIKVLQIRNNANKYLVHKTLRPGNEVSDVLEEDLKKKKKRAIFNRCITQSSQLPVIGIHIVSGKLSQGRGNYVSPLIGGPTLSNHSRLMKLNHHESIELLVACEILIKNLKVFRNTNGYIFGDWTLHNIVWNEETGVLMNIDLEGFYTYSSWGPELSWKGDEAKLHSIINRLREVVKMLLNKILSRDYRQKTITNVTIIKLPQGQLVVPFVLRTPYNWLREKSVILQLLPVSFSTQDTQTLDVYLSEPKSLRGPPRFLICESQTTKEVSPSLRYCFSFTHILDDPNYLNFKKINFKNNFKTNSSIFDLGFMWPINKSTGSFLYKSLINLK